MYNISFKNPDEFPYESQSEVELEEAIRLLSDSQQQIQNAELCADEFFSHGFAKKANTEEYVSCIHDKECKSRYDLSPG